MLTLSSAPTLVWYLVISVAFPWIWDLNWCREIQKIGLQPGQDQLLLEIFLCRPETKRLSWDVRSWIQKLTRPKSLETLSFFSSSKCCLSDLLCRPDPEFDSGSWCRGAAWDRALGLQPTISKAGYCYSDSRVSRTASLQYYGLFICFSRFPASKLLCKVMTEDMVSTASSIINKLPF